MSLILSSGADSQIVCWENVTEELIEEQNAKMLEEAQNIQNMENMLHNKNFSAALELALRLGRPSTALRALNEIESPEFQKIISGLTTTDKQKLLEFCAIWNRNSKTAYSAQMTLKKGENDLILFQKLTRLHGFITFSKLCGVLHAPTSRRESADK